MARLGPLLLILAVAGSVAACGSSSASSRTGYPTIKFVGDPSCPTSSASAYSPMPPDVNSLPPVGEAIDEMPHTHVAPPARITYNHNPPTSGCHYSLGNGTAPIAPGAYNQVIQPEYWVHNLEHGYIAVLYNCPNGCNDQFQQLRSWLKTLKPDAGLAYARVIVIPWPSMTVPFAAVSWDWYYPIPKFSIDEVQKFYANHTGHPDENAG